MGRSRYNNETLLVDLLQGPGGVIWLVVTLIEADLVALEERR